MTTSPRLGLPELAAGQAVPETTVNEENRYLEQGASYFIAKDRDLTAPPGSPADGDCYIVAASPTGAWSGKAKSLAFYLNTAWAFVTPIEGTRCYLQDENTVVEYSGSAWGAPSGGGGDVVGPASAVDNHVAVFDSTTGKLLKDGGVALLANGANITPAAAPATTAVGYLGAPQNTQNGTYTTVMSDAGKHIYHTSGSAHTWTIDSNANVAYPIGTILTFINENGGGVVTLAITSDTLRWGSSTGSRSLAANGTATAIKVASTTWRLTGDGIT